MYRLSFNMFIFMTGYMFGFYIGNSPVSDRERERQATRCRSC